MNGEHGTPRATGPDPLAGVGNRQRNESVESS